LEFQVAVVGAFAAIGLTAIGLAEKTAMADQEYRLLALHMFTTKNTARELKVALDALGQPLENVMWDPELAARFNSLVKDQRTLIEELGPTFDKNMVKIVPSFPLLFAGEAYNVEMGIAMRSLDKTGRCRVRNSWGAGFRQIA
jgi:hypothetical protein